MYDATDLESAKTRSFIPWAGLDTRAETNAERDPAELSLLELQFQLSHRVGPNRGSDDDENWGLRQARELGTLLAMETPAVVKSWLAGLELAGPALVKR